jgi:MFS family permease
MSDVQPPQRRSMNETQATLAPLTDTSVRPQLAAEATSLRDLTPEQWKGGLAAWLGWLFDGLDMHLYTLVATPFVAQLLVNQQQAGVDQKEPQYYASIIQAAFLLGWALGGGFFGVIGDKIGRTRALVLTILVYAAFTGLSFFAQAWWHLLIFRFVAALGIGGEWAVGASLLSETWPKRWRPWMAAVLQTAVNLGVMLASVAVYFMSELPYRAVFLVGVIPALLVLWIRKAVPETEEWHEARRAEGATTPGFAELFRGTLARTTFLVLAVCGLSLTAHWAFMFWCSQHLRQLMTAAELPPERITQLVTNGMNVVMITSIAGNFLAAWVARNIGYRRSITLFFLLYFASLFGAYSVPRDYQSLWVWLGCMGASSGVFALFTMYLPPLFPTLLRTTGAGFCYNFGRIAAAAGTIIFGLTTKVGDIRYALLYAGFLFLPAAVLAWSLPDLVDDAPSPLHEPTE